LGPPFSESGGAGGGAQSPGAKPCRATFILAIALESKAKIFSGSALYRKRAVSNLRREPALFEAVNNISCQMGEISDCDNRSAAVEASGLCDCYLSRDSKIALVSRLGNKAKFGFAIHMAQLSGAEERRVSFGSSSPNYVGPARRTGALNLVARFADQTDERLKACRRILG
jgi:hypothetical protein